ncbi:MULTISPECIES: hypothetical protein [unclassified Photobacterium]|uniref:hypothetical protein n=1 Tax=unclassified Photobacterium TaxID=2628852 RepID=UPI001EDD3675|nr:MULTISPECIES: hypothetical protein [unclassified Photobacterium]MCG3863513.1 hypothetical protein [Photobacterium sp. Ph6]MCG3875042.1 hypothetical protein [Photobacterium sp. Ph5]
MKNTLSSTLLFFVGATLSGCAQHYAAISDIPFVDANFKRCVILQGKAYSEQITELKCDGLHISKIKELSNFPNLQQLDLAHNQLSKLDISDNPKLELLSVEHNQLSKLKTKYNKKLKVLNVSFNHLTSLDVRKNKELTYLNYSGNHIKDVDIQNNPHLLAPYDKTYVTNGPSN